MHDIDMLLKNRNIHKMLSQFSHEFFKQKYGNHGVPVKCFGVSVQFNLIQAKLVTFLVIISQIGRGKHIFH